MRKVTTVHYEPPVRTLNGWDMKIAGTETKIEQEQYDVVRNNLFREKQIEEMEKYCPFYKEGNCLLLDEDVLECDFNCDMCDFAEHLCNAGYRKQSEVEELKAWVEAYKNTIASIERIDEELRTKLKNAKSEVAREIFEEIEKAICGTTAKNAIECTFEIDRIKYMEIKEKYTEDENELD